jgi:hypothetical protein
MTMIMLEKEWLDSKREFFIMAETFAFDTNDWITGRVCKAQIRLIDELLEKSIEVPRETENL